MKLFNVYTIYVSSNFSCLVVESKITLESMYKKLISIRANCIVDIMVCIINLV